MEPGDYTVVIPHLAHISSQQYEDHTCQQFDKPDCRIVTTKGDGRLVIFGRVDDAGNRARKTDRQPQPNQVFVEGNTMQQMIVLIQHRLNFNPHDLANKKTIGMPFAGHGVAIEKCTVNTIIELREEKDQCFAFVMAPKDLPLNQFYDLMLYTRSGRSDIWTLHGYTNSMLNYTGEYSKYPKMHSGDQFQMIEHCGAPDTPLKKISTLFHSVKPPSDDIQEVVLGVSGYKNTPLHMFKNDRPVLLINSSRNNVLYYVPVQLDQMTAGENSACFVVRLTRSGDNEWTVSSLNSRYLFGDVSSLAHCVPLI